MRRNQVDWNIFSGVCISQRIRPSNSSFSLRGFACPVLHLHTTTTPSLLSNLFLFFLRTSFSTRLILFLRIALLIPLPIFIPNFCPSTPALKRRKTTRLSPLFLVPFSIIRLNSYSFLTLRLFPNASFFALGMAFP